MSDRVTRRVLIGLSAIMLVLTAGLAGCTRKISDKDLVFVGTGEAEALLAGRPGVLGLGGKKGGVWVDPRSRAAFHTGHIPGAISMPYETVRADHEKLKEWGVVIVYGDDYNDPIARATSKTLLELGFKDVRTLDGGIRAWTDAGNELETGGGNE